MKPMSVLRAALIVLGGGLVLTGCFPRFPNPQTAAQQQPGTYDPSFSPDGSKILFADDRDGDLEIYVVNADGTGMRALTDNDTRDFFPTWSPDGSTIVFTSNRDGAMALYLMDADGGNQRRLIIDEQP